MADYFSTFTTGFSNLIPHAIQNLVPGIQIRHLYDGAVIYSFPGKETALCRIPFFHNTFLLLRSFPENNCTMDAMLRSILRLKQLPPARGSFRVRYSIHNQFVAMDKTITRQLEEKIAALTHTRVDRVSPDVEYWVLQRSEGMGAFCKLIRKRKVTEKQLHPGELRPEFAYLLCALARISKTDVVLDPFAGYGAIPKQIQQYFPCKRLLVSDFDVQRVRALQNKFLGTKTVQVSQQDALQLTGIQNQSIDAIVTDPPWGLYEILEEIDVFYRKMLLEFQRILKGSGTLVLVSARKQELESAFSETGFSICQKYDTLVNGKKAAVYVASL